MESTEPTAVVRAPGIDAAFERGGAPAVEVIAVFDGTIVEARHFDDPGAGALRRSTVWQLAGGGVSLAAALGLFVVAYFAGGGSALDVFAVLFVTGGAASLVRGLAARQEDRRPRDFTIGSGAGSLLAIEHAALPATGLPLLHSTGTSYELVVPEGVRGSLTQGGRTQPLDEAMRMAPPSEVVIGARVIPFSAGTNARVDLGETTIYLKSVPAPRRQPVPLRLDFASYRYTGGVLAAASLFLVLVFAIPPDASALSLGATDRNGRFARFILVPPAEPEVKQPEWMKKPDKAMGGKGRAAKGASGVLGKKDGPREKKHFQLQGPKDAPMHLASKSEVREMVRSIGVLGAMSSRSPTMASIFSTDVNAIGNDEKTILGGLQGNVAGESWGNGGQGLVGSGKGGGGTGTATIGVGSHLGTIGVGGGGCSGGDCVYGRKVAQLHDRSRHGAPVEVISSETKVSGGIGKDIIRRVIRQHINEMKFCYDEALQRHPDLAGRVIVQFAISPTGMVASSSVRESSVAAPEVGQCVSQAVRRLQFPAPPNAGLTIVSYPFAFHQAGKTE